MLAALLGLITWGGIALLVCLFLRHATSSTMKPPHKTKPRPKPRRPLDLPRLTGETLRAEGWVPTVTRRSIEGRGPGGRRIFRHERAFGWADVVAVHAENGVALAVRAFNGPAGPAALLRELTRALEGDLAAVSGWLVVEAWVWTRGGRGRPNRLKRYQASASPAGGWTLDEYGGAGYN